MAVKKRKIQTKSKVSSKKSNLKKRVKSSPAKLVKKASAPLKNKVELVAKRFAFFALLCVICLVLYGLSLGAFWMTLFGTLAILFGFIGLGLLITLLVLFFMKK